MSGAALYFVWDSNFSHWIYYATKILLLVWPLLWLGVVRQEFKKWKRGRFFLLSLLLMVVMTEIMLTALPLIDLQSIGLLVQEKAAAFKLHSRSLFIVFALFFSVLHSLLEEYYWRWFVFRGLMLKLNWKTSALLGSLAFAGHHYLVLSQFFSLPLTLAFGTAVGVAGFIWCTAYYKTRTLLPSYLSHIAVDAVIMGTGYAILF
jgi:membrane protease YdiL (CAAX protease family)